MTKTKAHCIGYFVFDGVQGLDLFGPLEAFQEANEHVEAARYKNIVISETGASVTSSSGVVINAHKSIKNCPPLDTLIIPGGEGARIPDFSDRAICWIANRAPRLERLGSVCTGLFILAQTGLLDGKRAATHWRHVGEARERFPDIDVADDALFVRDGAIITAAGVTAGIDMALSLIEEDLGPSAAALAARHLVVFLKRPGDQRQYSSALQQQTEGAGAFADLAAWIADNLNADLSSETLAERVGLSERQFRRRFTKAFGATPTRQVERMRIDTARRLLANENVSIEKIASDTGFTNADTFRRAFERLTGVAPSDYRHRFNGGV